MVCLCQPVGTKSCTALSSLLSVERVWVLKTTGQVMGTKLGKPDDDRHVSFGTAQEAGANAELPFPEQHVSGPCIASPSWLGLCAASTHPASTWCPYCGYELEGPSTLSIILHSTRRQRLWKAGENREPEKGATQLSQLPGVGRG